MLISVVIPVFRDGTRGRNAATSLLDQELPANSSIEVILVDDGSGDETASQLTELSDDRVRVIELPDNVGRSAARNAGAAAAAGLFILFMDCDCIPHDRNFIAAHCTALSGGAVASTGHVSGKGNEFWSRYQRLASRRRERQHHAGSQFAGSSQNLAVLADVFKAVGGFDSRYKRYGFEDRDLLIRLASEGRIAWTDGEGVIHHDELSALGVSSKMREAGAASSTLFSTRHPAAYAKLGYATVDARIHPAMTRFAPWAGDRLPLLAGIVDTAIRMPLPFFFKMALVRGLSGLSYWVGTSEAE